MNREQKLKFIQENHPELFKQLEEHVPNFISNCWNASINDINMYNAWVSFYCGKLGDTSLMNTLTI